MSVLKSIKRDIEAIRERDPAARSAAEVVLAYPGFHAREMHRLAHALHRRGMPVLPRAISNLSRFVTGIEIHPGATDRRRACSSTTAWASSSARRPRSATTATSCRA